MNLNFHINYDTHTTFRLVVTETDPVEYNTEVVVGEFWNIPIEEVNYIILNWKMVEAFGLEYMQSEDKGRLREY